MVKGWKEFISDNTLSDIARRWDSKSGYVHIIALSYKRIPDSRSAIGNFRALRNSKWNLTINKNNVSTYKKFNSKGSAVAYAMKYMRCH